MADRIEQQVFNEIIVDDGSVRVPIRNKQGDEIGVFMFRPTDIGIVDRFNSMTAEFDKIVEPLENVNIRADGTVDEKNEAEFSALREAEQKLYAACDKLFGGNMSDAFFGKMHPFSPINGRFYCENALEAVGRYISRQFDREVKKVNVRVERYTHGYRTGKHKGSKA
nr:MAG TPA: tail assembly chaperone [Caudoviricetes sp.]